MHECLQLSGFLPEQLKAKKHFFLENTKKTLTKAVNDIIFAEM